jgi:hypothetical protein
MPECDHAHAHLGRWESSSQSGTPIVPEAYGAITHVSNIHDKALPDGLTAARGETIRQRRQSRVQQF